MPTLVRAAEGVRVLGLAKQKLPLGRGEMQSLAPQIRLAQASFPGDAEVLVFPHGGITYPELA